MTYEEFKKELYRNIVQQENNTGRQVKLLEKCSICGTIEDMRLIRALNLNLYGVEDIILREDILCVFCGRGHMQSMLHWKVRSLYERFKKEGWQSVLPEIMIKLQQAEKIGKQMPINYDSYEISSENLILRPLNYHQCIDELDNCIYWKFGDIVLVLYGLIGDEDGQYLTMKIYREMTYRWNIEEEQLLTNALLNSYAKMPPRLYHAEQMLRNCNRTGGVFMPGEQGEHIIIHPENKWERLKGYRLTTTRQVNGALAIFYPGVKMRLAEIMGGDYFVGFTSIHEAVIHPISSRVLKEMKESIRHVNAVFDEKEMLTNQVYRYCCNRREMIEV